jgi:uncharacterized RDD family membrane protein YckC
MSATDETTPPAAATPAPGTCGACGRDRGPGVACQFCRHVQGAPDGIRLASPGKRLGGQLLDGVFAIFTLGIGWLIWSLIIFGRGQTPAKQVLGMRVLKLDTGARASWGTMFLRTFIIKPLLSSLTFAIGDLWLLWDKNNQELWDKVLSTIVVDDPRKEL